MNSLIRFVVSVFQIRKIRNEGEKFYDRKVEEIRDRLKHDSSISEEGLSERILQEVELARKEVVQEVERRIAIINKQE